MEEAPVVEHQCLYYGDVLAFQVEGDGYLACPSFYSDAIDELLAPQTQLRSAKLLAPTLKHLAANGAQPSGQPSRTSFFPTSNDAAAAAPATGRSFADAVTAVLGGTPATTPPQPPKDFVTRCAFQLLPDQAVSGGGQMPVTYGSIVRVMHQKTAYRIIATSTQVAAAAAGECKAMLKRTASQEEHSASLFYIVPRFSMRVEGEVVRTNDSIVLESVQFKGMQLCGPGGKASQKENSANSGGGVGGGGSGTEWTDHEAMVYTSNCAYRRRGWRVLRLCERRSAPPASVGAAAAAATAAAAGFGGAAGLAAAGGEALSSVAASRSLVGGDFVRFLHRHERGFLLARVDDGAERLSRIAPFSLLCKKRSRRASRVVLPFVRPVEEEDAAAADGGPLGGSGSGAAPAGAGGGAASAVAAAASSIWQVENERTEDGSEVEWLSGVRLRHLVTGQYLCIREVAAGDAPLLQKLATTLAAGSGYEKDGANAARAASRSASPARDVASAAAMPQGRTGAAAARACAGERLADRDVALAAFGGGSDAASSADGTVSPPIASSSPSPSPSPPAAASGPPAHKQSFLDSLGEHLRGRDPKLASKSAGKGGSGGGGGGQALLPATPSAHVSPEASPVRPRSPEGAAALLAERHTRIVVATTSLRSDPTTLFEMLPTLSDEAEDGGGGGGDGQQGGGGAAAAGKTPVLVNASVILRHRASRACFAVSPRTDSSASASSSPVRAAASSVAALPPQQHSAPGEFGSSGGWWEYANDRSLVASWGEPDSEVYRISPVTDEEVRDVLYLLRYRRLLTNAVVDAFDYRSSSRRGQPDPRFGRLTSALSALTAWVVGGIDEDGVIDTAEVAAWVAAGAVVPGSLAAAAAVAAGGGSVSRTRRTRQSQDQGSIAYPPNRRPSLAAGPSGAAADHTAAGDQRGGGAASASASNAGVFASLDGGRAAGASAAALPVRQELARDLCFVEYLMQLVTMYAALLKADRERGEGGGNDGGGGGGGGRRHSRHRHGGAASVAAAVPFEVTALCRGAYELLRHLLDGNRRAAATLKAMHGITHMVSQLQYDWRPPIRELILASSAAAAAEAGAASHAEGGSPAAFHYATGGHRRADAPAASGGGGSGSGGSGAAHGVLSRGEMYHLILLVRQSVRRGDLAAWSLLELLATVAVPNGRPSPPTQRFVCALVMGERVAEDSNVNDDEESASLGGESSVVGGGASASTLHADDCQPLLFKVRMLPPAPPDAAAAAGSGSGGGGAGGGGRARGWSVWTVGGGRERGGSVSAPPEAQAGIPDLLSESRTSAAAAAAGGGGTRFRLNSVAAAGVSGLNSLGAALGSGGESADDGLEEWAAPTARWQVSLEGLAAAAPRLQATPGEVNDYLRDEEALMRGLFRRYDRDSSGTIDRGELRLLCEDLGMVPALIDSTTGELPAELNFAGLLAWWQANRATFSVTGDIIMAAHAASAAAAEAASAARAAAAVAAGGGGGGRGGRPAADDRAQATRRRLFDATAAVSAPQGNASSNYPQPSAAHAAAAPGAGGGGGSGSRAFFRGPGDDAGGTGGEGGSIAALEEEDDSPVEMGRLAPRGEAVRRGTAGSHGGSGGGGASSEDEDEDDPFLGTVVRHAGETLLRRGPSLLVSPSAVDVGRFPPSSPAAESSAGLGASASFEPAAAAAAGGAGVLHSYLLSTQKQQQANYNNRFLSNVGSAPLTDGVVDGGWVDIGAVLAGNDEPRKRWLRSALRLLAAVCTGAHFGCQSAVSRLVPVDMLLDLLFASGSERLGDGDRAIVLELLRSVYVEHDLVFPPEALVPAQAVAVAVSRENFPSGITGKVFNYMTQSPPPGQRRVKHAQIASQRRRLMALVRSGLKALRLDVLTYEPPRYSDRCHAAVALARLARWLLRKGYFFRGGTDAPAGVLGHDGEQFVVEEEEAWLGSHWVHRPSRFERAIAHTREALPLNPLLPPAAAEAVAPPQRAPDVLFYHPDIEELLVEKWRAADAEQSRGSGGSSDVNAVGSATALAVARFDGAFANPLVVELKREILMSMEVLQAIRNLQGLKAVVHEAVGEEAGAALQADVVMPHQGLFEGSEGAEDRMEAAMEMLSQVVVPSDDKLRAVLDFTLHDSQPLLQRAYRFCLLLTLNDVHFVNLLNRFAIVGSPAVARTARTAHALAALFRKYSRGFADSGGGGGHGAAGDERALDVLLFTLSVLAAISVQELKPRKSKASSGGSGSGSGSQDEAAGEGGGVAGSGGGIGGVGAAEDDSEAEASSHHHPQRSLLGDAHESFGLSRRSLAASDGDGHGGEGGGPAAASPSATGASESSRQRRTAQEWFKHGPLQSARSRERSASSSGLFALVSGGSHGRDLFLPRPASQRRQGLAALAYSALDSPVGAIGELQRAVVSNVGVEGTSSSGAAEIVAVSLPNSPENSPSPSPSRTGGSRRGRRGVRSLAAEAGAALRVTKPRQTRSLSPQARESVRAAPMAVPTRGLNFGRGRSVASRTPFPEHLEEALQLYGISHALSAPAPLPMHQELLAGASTDALDFVEHILLAPTQPHRHQHHHHRNASGNAQGATASATADAGARTSALERFEVAVGALQPRQADVIDRALDLVQHTVRQNPRLAIRVVYAREGFIRLCAAFFPGAVALLSELSDAVNAICAAPEPWLSPGLGLSPAGAATSAQAEPRQSPTEDGADASFPSRWRFTLQPGSGRTVENGGGGAAAAASASGWGAAAAGSGDVGESAGVGAAVLGGARATANCLASSWAMDGSFEALMDSRFAILDPENDARARLSVAAAAAVAAEAAAVAPISFTSVEVDYFLWLGLEEAADGRWHPSALRVLRGMIRTPVQAVQVEGAADDEGSLGSLATVDRDRKGPSNAAEAPLNAAYGAPTASPASTSNSPGAARPPLKARLSPAALQVVTAVAEALSASDGRLRRFLLLEKLPQTDGEVAGHIELARLVAAAASPASPEAALAALRSAAPPARVATLLRRPVPLQLQAALLELLRCMLVLAPAPAIAAQGPPSPPGLPNRQPAAAQQQRQQRAAPTGPPPVARHGSAANVATAGGAMAAATLGRKSTAKLLPRRSPSPPSPEGASSSRHQGDAHPAAAAAEAAAGRADANATGAAVRELLTQELVEALGVVAATARCVAIICWLEEHPDAAPGNNNSSSSNNNDVSGRGAASTTSGSWRNAQSSPPQPNQPAARKQLRIDARRLLACLDEGHVPLALSAAAVLAPAVDPDAMAAWLAQLDAAGVARGQGFSRVTSFQRLPSLHRGHSPTPADSGRTTRFGTAAAAAAAASAVSGGVANASPAALDGETIPESAPTPPATSGSGPPSAAAAAAAAPAAAPGGGSGLTVGAGSVGRRLKERGGALLGHRLRKHKETTARAVGSGDPLSAVAEGVYAELQDTAHIFAYMVLELETWRRHLQERPIALRQTLLLLVKAAMIAPPGARYTVTPAYKASNVLVDAIAALRSVRHAQRALEPSRHTAIASATSALAARMRTELRLRRAALRISCLPPAAASALLEGPGLACVPMRLRRRIRGLLSEGGPHERADGGGSGGGGGGGLAHGLGEARRLSRRSGAVDGDDKRLLEAEGAAEEAEEGAEEGARGAQSVVSRAAVSLRSASAALWRRARRSIAPRDGDDSTNGTNDNEEDDDALFGGDREAAQQARGYSIENGEAAAVAAQTAAAAAAATAAGEEAAAEVRRLLLVGIPPTPQQQRGSTDAAVGEGSRGGSPSPLHSPARFDSGAAARAALEGDDNVSAASSGDASVSPWLDVPLDPPGAAAAAAAEAAAAAAAVASSSDGRQDLTIYDVAGVRLGPMQAYSVIPPALRARSALRRLLRAQLAGYVRFRSGRKNLASRVTLLGRSEPFALWRQHGGRCLRHLVASLPALAERDLDTALFFLELLQGTLASDVDALRADGSISARRRVKLVEKEVRRAQEVQNALHALGAHTMFLTIIARAESYLEQDADPALAVRLLPRVLELGTALLSHGNRAVQDSVVATYEAACAEVGAGPGAQVRGFARGMRSILRFVRLQMEALGTLSTSAAVQNVTASSSTNSGKLAGSVALASEAAATATAAAVAAAADARIALASRYWPLCRAAFDFLRSMCAGNNARAKGFLRQQRGGVEQVNLVDNTSSLVYSICQLLSSRMRYISSPEFRRHLAPELPSGTGSGGSGGGGGGSSGGASDGGRRDYIAWHRTEVCFPLVRDLLLLASAGFRALTEMCQGPEPDNQLLCVRTTTFAGTVLQYVGSMHLRLRGTRSPNSGGGFAAFGGDSGSSGGGGGGSAAAGKVLTLLQPKPRVWNGGNPHRFYRELCEEMEAGNAALASDPEAEQWRAARATWDAVAAGRERPWWHWRTPSKLLGLGKGSNDAPAVGNASKNGLGGGFKSGYWGSNSEGAPRTSADVLGVPIEELLRAAGRCEQDLLKLLMGMLEGQSPAIVRQLAQQTDPAILVQNMASEFSNSSRPPRRSGRASRNNSGGGGNAEDSAFKNDDRVANAKTNVVLYQTLVTSLAEASRGAYAENSKALLDDFAKANEAHGTASDELIAAVEIIGADETLQQVFFPVPPFVRQYWSYPEVHKARRALLYSVSRESPDEKILDFYDKMDEIIQTMRRQELLHKAFGPFHSLVGGKSGSFVPRWFPDQRFLLFIITLWLNFWLIYTRYRTDVPYYTDPFVTDQMFNWKHRDFTLNITQYTHAGLCGSLLFSRLINSRAYIAAGRRHYRLWAARPAMMCLAVLLDGLWMGVMMACSILGIFFGLVWYSVHVMDLIPQIRLMGFLVDAVTRNAGKIMVTVLLLMVALYLYSVVTYLAWHDQYNFGGHSGCNTLLTCWLLHVDYGMLDSPDWDGDSVIVPLVPPIHSSPLGISFYHAATVIGASLYQLSYIILINLVMGALISGLIIDTFSEMRQENEAVEEDIREKCFICSIDRDSFEQIGVEFSEHIRKDHNMWAYIWFRLYLEHKDPLSYTGPEHHAAANFADKGSFARMVPIKKALAFSREAGAIRETVDLASLYAKVKELGSATSGVERLVRDRLGGQEEEAKRARTLGKQVDQLAKTLRRMERRLDENSRGGGGGGGGIGGILGGAAGGQGQSPMALLASAFRAQQSGRFGPSGTRPDLAEGGRAGSGGGGGGGGGSGGGRDAGGGGDAGGASEDVGME